MTGCLYLLLLPSWLSLLIKLFLFIHITGLDDNLFPGWLTLLIIPLCLSGFIHISGSIDFAHNTSYPLFIHISGLIGLAVSIYSYVFPDWLTLYIKPSCLYSIYSYFLIDWFCSYNARHPLFTHISGLIDFDHNSKLPLFAPNCWGWTFPNGSSTTGSDLKNLLPRSHYWGILRPLRTQSRGQGSAQARCLSQ
jgi:hypothetical protein